MERAITCPDQGFSLIEMVIVVAVIAVMSITAVFSVGRGGFASQNDALRFGAAYERLRDAAILSRGSRAMSLSADGWQSLEPGKDHKWVAIGASQKFRGEARFQGRSGALGRSVTGEQPDLIFLSDGQVTAFEVSFISASQVTRCTGSGWEGMTCEGG